MTPLLRKFIHTAADRAYFWWEENKASGEDCITVADRLGWFSDYVDNIDNESLVYIAGIPNGSDKIAEMIRDEINKGVMAFLNRCEWWRS